MTEREKQFYNLYLVTSRSVRNKPFSKRKNWDGFEDKPEYLAIRKVCNLFNNHPQIKPEIYFKAPFKVYPDTEHFPIEFFATQKAIKVYTMYLKTQQEMSPDTDEQIQFIKDSLRYIAMYCVRNKINIYEYITHKSGITYSWMQHVRQHYVSIYALFEYAELPSVVNSIPEDEKDLFLGNIAEELFAYKTRYMRSITAKRVVQEGMKRITKVVDEHNKIKSKKS